MPHLILEVSGNLRAHLVPDVTLEAAHQALLDSGVFDGPDVKSRLNWCDVFTVGRAGASEGFVHASLELLEGRSPSVQQRLSAGVVAAVLRTLPAQGCPPVQVSCDVRDMKREAYAKAIHNG